MFPCLCGRDTSARARAPVSHGLAHTFATRWKYVEGRIYLNNIACVHTEYLCTSDIYDLVRNITVAVAASHFLISEEERYSRASCLIYAKC